jgi:hypothetical protein
MQMARAGAAAVAVAVAVLAVASSLGQAATSPSSAVEVSAGSLCKLKGIRYSGRTSQSKPFCLTLWPSGKRISEYAYGFRDNCGGAGTSRTTARNGLPVGGDGSFASSGASGSFFKGRVSGSRVRGSLRTRSTQYGVIPPVTCDTGVVRWTAQRKS